MAEGLFQTAKKMISIPNGTSTKMNVLVSKKEEKALKKLLSLSPVPEITLSYEELLGYIYGLAITPENVAPEEWFSVIFSEEAVPYESDEQARELTGVLFSVLNKHIAAFQQQSLYIPFSMESLREDEYERVFEWASGFEEALSLRPECWEEHDGLSDDEMDNLMNSLIVIEGIVYPEDAVDMFDHIPKEELLRIGVNLSGNDINKVMQVQFFMLQALELSVETIQSHAFTLEQKRKMKNFSLVGSKESKTEEQEKSEPCPCGSGLPFDKCCSLPDQKELNSGAGKKRGKLIKVDFSAGKKSRGRKSEVRTLRASGAIYELEISLAYTEPQVWRSIQIHNSHTLAEFHFILQLIMGWQDTHMHQFQVGVKFYGPAASGVSNDFSMKDEAKYTLAHLEKDLLQGIVYTYDFGDNWEHVITLKKVIPEGEGPAIPVVVDGARACPPEDLGGVPMYQSLLDYLNGKKIEELEDIFSEPSLKGYDPEAFDQRKLNQLLESIYRDD